MTTGTIRLFHSAKHYAFIQQDSGGVDIFVPPSSVRAAGLKKLRKGQRVSYDIVENGGRVIARNLRVTRTLEEVLEEKRALIEPGEVVDDDARSASITSDGRTGLSRVELEKAMLETIKASGPECESFVAVIVEKMVPAQLGDANWRIKGVKYGRADRERCGPAIAKCERRMQLAFALVD